MTLRFTLLNVQGLVTRRTNKLKSCEMQKNFNSSDAVLFTETWTNDLSNIDVNNFESFVLNRKEQKKKCKRNSGGIILYLRNNLVDKDTLVFLDDEDFLWVKISKSILSSENDLYICLCYFIPENSSRQSMTESNVFDRLLDSVVFIENKSNNNCSMLICGDFNSRTSTKPDFVEDDGNVHISVLPDEYIPDNFLQRFSEDDGHENSNGLLLLDFCKQTGLRIMNGRVGDDYGVGRFTFVGSRGSSVVDYIISSQDLFQRVKLFVVEDPNIMSDHCAIKFSLEFENANFQNSESGECGFVDGKFKWNSEFKADYIQSFQQQGTVDKLQNLNQQILDSSCNEEIDSCISVFTNLISDISSPIFKSSRRDKNDQNLFSKQKDTPWFDDRCEEKRHYFLHYLSRYRASKTDENRRNLAKARSEYKCFIRKCRYNYDKDKTSQFVNTKYKNAKLYWNLLKDAAGIKPSNIQLSTFERYFNAINNPSDPFYRPDEDIIYFNERYENEEFGIMFDELNVVFSQEEISKAIQQLKNGKSAGPDKLINEFFIHGNTYLCPILCNLFNRLFETGYFPDTWTEGYIIPLHKKGSINDVENYRGITLLSVLGKLFSSVINNRLSDWAERYFILIEAQAGFRSHMSTVDNIFVLHNLISHVLNQGKQLYCVFIDFTKAFDYVVRDNLWYKLVKLGLRGKILNIVKSMYQTVKSRVKVFNSLGNEFYCSLGVRQGECLSPLLFSFYLNDIEEQFLNSNMDGLEVDMVKIFMLLYADDIVFFANTPEELQLGLDLLADYCKRWKLTINVSKTKVLIFRNGGPLPMDISFKYNGTPLEIVSSFKYLGIVFTVGGSFSEAQKTLAGQAQKAIFKLNKYLYKFTFITPMHKFELFDKLITPILNYGSEVWGFAKANAIERIHMQFCKKILGVKKTTQNDFIYGELGRTNYLTNRYLIIIKYWFKILQSPANKYIKLVYNLMVQDLETLPNKVNWASLLRHLLRSLGFNEVWLNQGVGDIGAFLGRVKQRLTDNFIQDWQARLNDSSRANFYTNICSFRFQPYLDCINVSKYIQALSKLRTSSHRLAIEAGRWTHTQKISSSNIGLIELGD